jgi:hypothetical protein
VLAIYDIISLRFQMASFQKLKFAIKVPLEFITWNLSVMKVIFFLFPALCVNFVLQFCSTEFFLGMGVLTSNP